VRLLSVKADNCLARGYFFPVFNATIVLYDGNPNYPDPGAMWKLIQAEQITIFGCSASYIHFLKKENISPSSTYDLSSLREISQTGSPLSAEGFEYVYQEIKSDLHFNSISGGTDVNGCFAAGSPILPVYAGELQSPGLAMKIQAYDEKGKPVFDQQGELVCEAPAPSMPLYFWNDPDGSKYHSAYFDVYPNVWRHGDYILVHSDTGGITFYGRSDAVLKPSGVRIGTAEIYAQMEKLADRKPSQRLPAQMPVEREELRAVVRGVTEHDHRTIVLRRRVVGERVDDAWQRRKDRRSRVSEQV